MTCQESARKCEQLALELQRAVVHQIDTGVEIDLEWLWNQAKAIEDVATAVVHAHSCSGATAVFAKRVLTDT